MLIIKILLVLIGRASVSCHPAFIKEQTDKYESLNQHEVNNIGHVSEESSKEILQFSPSVQNVYTPNVKSIEKELSTTTSDFVHVNPEKKSPNADIQAKFLTALINNIFPNDFQEKSEEFTDVSNNSFKNPSDTRKNVGGTSNYKYDFLDLHQINNTRHKSEESSEEILQFSQSLKNSHTPSRNVIENLLPSINTTQQERINPTTNSTHDHMQAIQQAEFLTALINSIFSNDFKEPIPEEFTDLSNNVSIYSSNIMENLGGSNNSTTIEEKDNIINNSFNELLQSQGQETVVKLQAAPTPFLLPSLSSQTESTNIENTISIKNIDISTTKPLNQAIYTTQQSTRSSISSEENPTVKHLSSEYEELISTELLPFTNIDTSLLHSIFLNNASHNNVLNSSSENQQISDSIALPDSSIEDLTADVFTYMPLRPSEDPIADSISRNHSVIMSSDLHDTKIYSIPTRIEESNATELPSLKYNFSSEFKASDSAQDMPSTISELDLKYNEQGIPDKPFNPKPPTLVSHMNVLPEVLDTIEYIALHPQISNQFTNRQNSYKASEPLDPALIYPLIPPSYIAQNIIGYNFDLPVSSASPQLIVEKKYSKNTVDEMPMNRRMEKLFPIFSPYAIPEVKYKHRGGQFARKLIPLFEENMDREFPSKVPLPSCEPDNTYNFDISKVFESKRCSNRITVQGDKDMVPFRGRRVWPRKSLNEMPLARRHRRRPSFTRAKKYRIFRPNLLN